MSRTSTLTRSTLARPAGLITAALLLAACGAGSSGEPPTADLGGQVHMGAVELVVSDLDGLHRFYADGVGLTTLSQDETQVVLGLEGTELLRLTAAQDGDLARSDPREAGLYHSAFLFADQPELAGAIQRTALGWPASFQGSSDHLVSEAFYFADPEGNGVELYADRPEESWAWRDGSVTMGSAALDPNAFLDEHLDGAAPAERAEAVTVGHVHLRGGDLTEAERFYSDALGLAVTSRGEGALFLAADGYHHHVAVNTWSSAGAGARTPSLGLGALTLVVPDDAELDAAADRLTAAGHTVDDVDGELHVDDPWGNRVVLRSQP